MRIDKGEKYRKSFDDLLKQIRGAADISEESNEIFDEPVEIIYGEEEATEDSSTHDEESDWSEEEEYRNEEEDDEYDNLPEYEYEEAINMQDFGGFELLTPDTVTPLAPTELRQIFHPEGDPVSVGEEYPPQQPKTHSLETEGSYKVVRRRKKETRRCPTEY